MLNALSKSFSFALLASCLISCSRPEYLVVDQTFSTGESFVVKVPFHSFRFSDGDYFDPFEVPLELVWKEVTRLVDAHGDNSSDLVLSSLKYRLGSGDGRKECFIVVEAKCGDSGMMHVYVFRSDLHFLSAKSFVP